MPEILPDSPRLVALTERVVVADKAVGTMIHARHLDLDDFEGHEGCNEILNVTRPDVIREIHAAYCEAGSDAGGESRIGVTLPEEFRLHPERSTSAIVVHHPEAKYFAV